MKPKVILTRKLSDSVETRMRELFDAELSSDDLFAGSMLVDAPPASSFAKVWASRAGSTSIFTSVNSVTLAFFFLSEIIGAQRSGCDWDEIRCTRSTEEATKTTRMRGGGMVRRQAKGR